MLRPAGRLRTGQLRAAAHRAADAPRWAGPAPRWAGPAPRNRLCTTDTRQAVTVGRRYSLDMARATVVLPVTPPFRLDLTVWALRRRTKNAVDRWDDGRYSRVIVVDGDPARLTVIQETTGLVPTLTVTVESPTRISMRAR